MPPKVTSDLASPLIAAVYLLMLPIWVLVFVQQLGDTSANRTLMLVVCGVLIVVSATQFLKGLGLARQRVEADAGGLRLLGLGGFDLLWADIVSITVTVKPRTGNVVVRLAPERTVPSEMLVGRTAVRRFGVHPDAVEALKALASGHGVSVE